MKRAPLEKSSQSPTKSSESKEGSFDNTTISPRNLFNMEDASSSPEKNSPSSSDEFLSLVEQKTDKFKVKRSSLDLSEAKKRASLKEENQSNPGNRKNAEDLPKIPFIILDLGEKKQQPTKETTNSREKANSQDNSLIFQKGNTINIIETYEKKKDKYTEKTPLLIDQKTQNPQQKPTFPFNNNPNKKIEELKVLKKGSINNSENQYSSLKEEEKEIIFQKDHKDNKKGGNSDSVDNFDFTLIGDVDKRGCCCNRPCLPHPELYWLPVSDLRNVIENSEKDELEDKEEVKRPKIINLPNVTENIKEKKSSQSSIIPSTMLIEGDEKNLKISPYVEKLNNFDFKQLSQHTKNQLNFINREIEGPWPKWEWIKNKQWGKLKEWAKNELPGFVVGGGVGVWLSRAMVPVYASAIDYLGFTYITFDEKPWVNIMRGIGKNLPSYIIPSVMEDAVPRNVILWRKGLTLLKEESLSKKRIALTALASFFPSLFEPFYLVLFELQLIQNAILNEDDTGPYKREMLKYVWPLFMDSWASNFQTTWDLWDDYQEWKESTSCCLFSKTLHTRIPSEEELARRDFRKKLDKVNRFLYHTASNKEIETLYKTVQGSKEEAGKQFGNLDEESLSNAQALLTFNYLLSMGDDLEQTQRYIKSWYDIGADILTDFCLVTGSPARLMVLQLIVSSITGLIPMPSWLRHTFNWGLAGIGWVPQTLLEWKGMDSFLKQFLAQEEPDSEAIYKGAKVLGGFRVGAKAYALGQALIFTIPLIITVLQVVNKWKMDPHWMIGAATFLFAEFATQASQQWERSAQKWVSLFANAHNIAIRDKCLKKPLRIEYQRSHLIELNQKFKDRLPYLTPEFLQLLKGNMNLKDNLTEEEN